MGQRTSNWTKLLEPLPDFIGHRVDSQKRRWPDGNGDFADPATGEKQRAQAQQHSIKRVEAGPSPSRAGDDEQLMLEKKVFGEHRLCAAWPEELGDYREQMYEEHQGFLHSEPA